MKKKKIAQSQAQAMEALEEEDILNLPSTSKSDICEILMDRYSKSSAPQHQHLCASAAAMKSILQEENLPLTPLTYFAATISAINDATESSFDPVSISPLSSFLSILLPLLPSQSLLANKAGDAVDVLVLLLQKTEGEGEGGVSTATMRCVVNCLGGLILLCDLEDWSKVKVPFEMILRFSIDKRPKVRRCAQVCVEKVFRSFPPPIVKEASKVVLSLFRSYMPRANKLNDSRFVDGSKREMLSKPEHLKVVHVLNSLKHIAPYLSKKVSQKILSDLYKLLKCEFSPITRHLFDILEVFFKSSGADVLVPEAENIIISLASYVSSGEKNPSDTIISVSSLLKNVMDKLYGEEPSVCMERFPLVFGSIAGLLVVDTYSSHAAGILKELINKHISGSTFLGVEYQAHDEKFMVKEESRMIKSSCAVLENILCNSDGLPNEHTLAVISNLFIKLGGVSYIFMKDVLLKLAGLIMLKENNQTEKEHLHNCIGSAVMAIGPEKMLTLIPVSLDPEKHVCSNIWVVPVLNKYISGASLRYFLKHIVPLVSSVQKACQRVKKSSLRQDLQASVHVLWGLLPAFCRYPTDTHKYFEPLAKILTDFLKEDNSMHENIAIALQELVNQNRNILASTETVSGSVETSGVYTIQDTNGESISIPSHYSSEVATRNIQALASCSMDLLQALTNVFFNSPPENRTRLKEAIGCLACITESSKVKELFILSSEKFQVINVDGESHKLESDTCTPVDKDLNANSKIEEHEEGQRCMLMEFAHSLIAGAKEDLLDTIFNYIKPGLQATTGVGQSEAYCVLSRIFEENTWFSSSRIDEMVELLLGLKSPVDIMTLRCRFSCFQTLLVYILKSDLEDRDAKAFLILNEIILALKDCNEEARQAAYDILLKISDSLNNSSSANSDSPLQQLFNMIMGYLSGAPPPIMSAAVAALSLLIYKNSSYCFSVPELVPSLLSLLRSKAKEVIKAVLGFVKVLVSCIQASELQKLLPDVVNGILPWSSVSKNHFRSKVTTIFEIIIRKCGYASVQFLVPDRYRSFIKTVKEQRHGKTSSKEAKPSDTMPNPAVSSAEREHKRSHGVPTQGSETDLRESKKRKFNNPSTNEPKKSTGFDRGQWAKKGRSGGDRKPTKRKDWSKGPSGGVRQRKETKSNKPPFRKSAPNSKFRKRQKAD